MTKDIHWVHFRLDLQDENNTQLELERSLASEGYDGTLEWSPLQQSQLFSSLFYGSLVTIGMAGWMADRYSPKRLLLFSIVSYSLMQIASPVVALHSNYYVYWAMR